MVEWSRLSFHPRRSSSDACHKQLSTESIGLLLVFAIELLAFFFFDGCCLLVEPGSHVGVLHEFLLL